MGRSPCCDKIGLKKGPWTPEEDHKLLAYIEEHGHGSWRALPAKAGLQRCGKSCRLRWTNYLRPDIKRGKFSLQEEQTIIQLHALLGNRWSAIATHLPKRTDNEIKNYWNTHLKKRLAKMGIDPVTHKPKNDALLSSDGQSKNAANLSHMAQWESARLEAEARLVRQSKLRSCSSPAAFQAQSAEAGSSSSQLHKPVGTPSCLDVLKAWSGGGSGWAKTTEAVGVSAAGIGGDMESPTSTLSSAAGVGESSAAFVEFVRNPSAGSCDGGIGKEDGDEEWKNLPEYRDGIGTSIPFTSGLHDTCLSSEWASESSRRNTAEHVPCGNFVEKFTDLLLSTSSGVRRFSDDGGESDNATGSPSDGGGNDCSEDNKNYWNNILNLVNSSPSDSPIF